MVGKASLSKVVAGLVLACLLIVGVNGSALAQSAPSAPESASPPAAAAPATSAVPTPTPTPPASGTASPPTASPPAAAAPGPDTGDSSTGQTLDLVARTAAYVEGKANWDEGFAAINGSLATIGAELAKAGIKPTGHPLAVFLETDDAGFRYRAMIPIDAPPDGKDSLSDVVKIGKTPAGKAMKFEHRGSYTDIDSTYEAITAYLDEKGLEAENLFIEEYLNDVKTTDDPTLEVDIFVLLK
jgi:effector-binding domain-containing protein